MPEPEQMPLSLVVLLWEPDQLNQNYCNSGTMGGATTSTCDLIQTLLAGAHPIKALMQFLNTMQSPEYD